MAGKNEEAPELDLPTTPDPFLEPARRGMEWAESNWRVLAGVLAAVLVGVIAMEMVGASSDRSASTMTMTLSEALDAYEESVSLQTVVTSTDAAKLKDGWAKAREKLSAFRKANPDGEGARLAGLYEADLARRLGDASGSAQLYRAYAETASALDPLAFVAVEGAGQALEAEGKLDEAIAQFDKLATTAPFAKDHALKGKARLLEKKGDAPGAKAAYQAIVDMDPASDLKTFAEDRLKALQ